MAIAADMHFKDRYLIAHSVGTGGIGTVYKALDTQHNNHPVAIKEIDLQRLSFRAAEEARESFQRESSILSQLQHSNLPSIYEYDNDCNYCYLVMDFIEGETLEEYLSRRQDNYFPLSEVLALGVQLCSVLKYLHSQQPPIIFRDLKPANIIRTPHKRYYLIDFGIARYFKPGQTRDTIPLGSPGYAAPEQYGRAQTTPGSDIYSLGVILHQLLTHKDPTETPFQFAPLTVNSHLSMVRLGDLIMQMVERDKDKRPASIAIIEQELQQIAKVWSAINRNFGVRV